MSGPFLSFQAWGLPSNWPPGLTHHGLSAPVPTCLSGRVGPRGVGRAGRLPLGSKEGGVRRAWLIEKPGEVGREVEVESKGRGAVTPFIHSLSESLDGSNPAGAKS